MSSKRRLLLLTCVATVGVGAATAPSALAAAPTPVTGGATAIGPKSAIVTAAIAPAGWAVVYEFQYGTTSKYSLHTKPVTLPASSKPEFVAANLTNLAPGAVYHYRLAVLIGGFLVKYYYPYLVPYYGHDAAFTTKLLGSFTLPSTKLSVKRRMASVPVKCASTQACLGKLTLTKRMKVGGHFQTMTLGSKTFLIRAGQTAKLSFKLSKLTGTLLALAKHHRITATATGGLITGQTGFKKTVSLIRR